MTRTRFLIRRRRKNEKAGGQTKNTRRRAPAFFSKSTQTPAFAPA